MLGNWIKETTTTTGTGALTLSAVTGFPRVSDWFADNDVVQYSLLDSSGNPIESGIGTVSATSHTLTRSIVTATYVAGALVKAGGTVTPATLSGTTTVLITPIAGGMAPGRKAVLQVNVAAQLIAAFPEGYYISNGGSVGANTIYISEYAHRTPRQIKGFRVYVGTSSGNINFALYRINADGTLGAQLCTTGSKPTVSGLTAYPLVSPVFLPPDYYACAVQVDNATATFKTTNTVTGFTGFGCDSSGLPNSVVVNSPGSFALPSPWSGAVASGGNGPLVYVELQ